VTDDLETLIRNRQNELRDPRRFTHPVIVIDERSLTERVGDWIDEHEYGLLNWSIVATGAALILIVVCLLVMISVRVVS
jgi:hypothetical protein